MEKKYVKQCSNQCELYDSQGYTQYTQCLEVFPGCNKIIICSLKYTHNCCCEKPIEGKVFLCNSFKAKENGIDKCNKQLTGDFHCIWIIMFTEERESYTYLGYFGLPSVLQLDYITVYNKTLTDTVTLSMLVIMPVCC